MNNALEKNIEQIKLKEKLEPKGQKEFRKESSLIPII
jgi:hypothetical protein